MLSLDRRGFVRVRNWDLIKKCSGLGVCSLGLISATILSNWKEGVLGFRFM